LTRHTAHAKLRLEHFKNKQNAKTKKINFLFRANSSTLGAVTTGIARQSRLGKSDNGP
jgi:hypothetical protein